MHSYGSSTLNQDVVISFISGKLKTYNSPVQLKYIPDVAVAQSEKVTVQLPFYDVDNDVVSCRWADNVAEGGGIFLARFGTLFEVIPWLYVVLFVSNFFSRTRGVYKYGILDRNFPSPVSQTIYQDSSVSSKEDCYELREFFFRGPQFADDIIVMLY